jgi:hypothetical protein
LGICQVLPATGAVSLGDTSDVDRSEGAPSNPESHTFGLPVVGGAGSLLPRRAGVRAHTLEGDPRRSSVSVSSSSSAAAATAAVAAQCLCVRDRLEGRWPHQSQGAVVRVCVALLLYHLRGSVRGHNYNRLTCLDRRVHGNRNNNRMKRHRHHRRRFCRSPCGLKILRAGRQQHGR